jgi:hypothetical protein
LYFKELNSVLSLKLIKKEFYNQFKSIFIKYYINLTRRGKMPYYVYVIELNSDVLKSKKFRLKNPNFKLKKPCVYVGQSFHEPITRFNQHKQGYKSNGFVKRYGTRLLPKLYRKYNPIESRKNAEAIEEKLTIKLRSKGYGVWSN